MSNILLIEPSYRSKFPPLGLLKLSTFHKRKGDTVAFARGLDNDLRSIHWHRIYISSLFTWELPKTVKTIKYYSSAVSSPKNIYVGGIGATLLPEYIRKNTDCTIIEGPLDKPRILGRDSAKILQLTPDYSLLDSVDYRYQPEDAYFVRVTKGCIRKCAFCAVPRLEPEFGFLNGIKKQIQAVDRIYGEKQHLVVLDNNILGVDNIDGILSRLADIGFHKGATRNGKLRAIDFNQGIDARLISKRPRLAKILGSTCLSPVRLAFDYMGVENSYRRAVAHLAAQGFSKFTNYMLFNFNDTPKDLYNRFLINAELNKEHKISITGFPMRYIPTDAVQRGYVSKHWNWKFLRGIQCVLIITHGLVSPNQNFIWAAFGKDYKEFLEILSMPDRYIIWREHYKNDGAEDWKKQFQCLSDSDKKELYNLLEKLHKDPNRKKTIQNLGKFRSIIEHYYPNGNKPSKALGNNKQISNKN